MSGHTATLGMSPGGKTLGASLLMLHLAGCSAQSSSPDEASVVRQVVAAVDSFGELNRPSTLDVPANESSA